jgi:hypothetical protein
MFNIGDKVYTARVEYRAKSITCPDCFGKARLTVILGDGEQVQVDCTQCSHGYDGSTGRINSYDYFPEVNERIITGITIKNDGIEYYCSSWIIDGEKVFATREEAEKMAIVLTREDEGRELKKLMSKHKDTRSWAWNATYHRGCIRQAEKDLAYHKAKLGYALPHVKEEKLDKQAK